MNCRQCARPVEADQRFCRSCGEKLTIGGRIHFRAVGMGLLTLMFIGLMVAIFGKMFGMKWLAYSGLAVMMTGAFVMAAYGFIRETRPKRDGMSVNSGLPAPIEKANTTNKLLTVATLEAGTSVIDNTTEFLKKPAKGPS